LPGYYDWKIRNCGDGAIAKANSLRQTMEMVDPELHRIWDSNGGEFPLDVKAHLGDVVSEIDAAEDALERGKLLLAKLFPGQP
jgi:hypothetical protein